MLRFLVGFHGVGFLVALIFCVANSRVIVAATGDENWDSRFGLPGAVGGSFLTVNAFAGSGTNIYVGGNFNQIGGVSATNIARWDGQKFYPLGGGIDAPRYSIFHPMVSAIAVSGSNVYVGGWFTSAGGVAATNIARWDGVAWHNMGSGLGFYNTNIFFIASVNALSTMGSDLFAGGGFTNAGGISAIGIARWDGSTWTSLTNTVPYDDVGTLAYAKVNGVGGVVQALAVKGTNLYAAGRFKALSEVQSFGNDVFASINATNIGVWNGIKWTRLANGVGSQTANIGALAIAFLRNDLIVGGEFTSASGVAANHIAQWNGTNWLAMGNGFDGNVNSLAAMGENVYAVGAFSTNGSTPMTRISRWNGTTWNSLGSGLDTNANYVGQAALNLSTDPHLNFADLLVGGNFKSAGGRTASGFAIWRQPAPIITDQFPIILNHTLAGKSLKLNWDISSLGPTLETADHFPAATNEWMTIPGTGSATVTIGKSNQFFRLRKP